MNDFKSVNIINFMIKVAHLSEEIYLNFEKNCETEKEEIVNLLKRCATEFLLNNFIQ